jgi:hypothetical protein
MSESKKIVVIGDSHSSLFDNNHTERKRGSWEDSALESLFDVRWLGPLTLWRVIRDRENCINFKEGVMYDPTGSMQISTKLELGQDVILVFGEIDIRCHIYNIKGELYRQLIDKMILNLEDFLSKHKDSYKIHICSILPPMSEAKCTSPDSHFPFIGSDSYRCEVTKYFNSKLKELTDNINLGYFDIYEMYSDENNMLEFDKSDTIVHGIKTKELENYIKKYFSYEK